MLRKAEVWTNWEQSQRLSLVRRTNFQVQS